MIRQTPARLVIVDDHQIVLDGIASIIRRGNGLDIVGQASTAAAAIELSRQLHPDVVLLDLSLPDMVAPEATRALKAQSPAPKVLVFTAFADHQSIGEVWRARADGLLLKDAMHLDLGRMIQRILAGERVLDSRLNAGPQPPVGGDGSGVSLTSREYQVLRRSAMGETNPEIAEALDLSRNTVKTYLQSTFQKLGARNRVEAIAKARAMHLL